MIIHEVEQRSLDWYALRLGLPTASEFGKLVTSKDEPSKSAATYAITLAAELFAGKALDAWTGNDWTERGRELEERALELYEFAGEVELQRVGFVTDDAKTMGASPDALVDEDGLVEVKCLKAENHVKALLYHRKHGRCPPDYIQQAQGQMLVTGRKWCDIIFYHPELPLVTIRVTPDKLLQTALRKSIAWVNEERDRVLAELRQHGKPASEAA